MLSLTINLKFFVREMVSHYVLVKWFFSAEVFEYHSKIKYKEKYQARHYASILLDERHVEEANVSFSSWSEVDQDLNKVPFMFSKYFSSVPTFLFLLAPCEKGRFTCQKAQNQFLSERK